MHGLVEHPFAHRFYQSGFFGQRDKLIWWDQAKVGVLPADKGFDAADHSSLHIHYGLIMQGKFILCHGAAQALL